MSYPGYPGPYGPPPPWPGHPPPPWPENPPGYHHRPPYYPPPHQDPLYPPPPDGGAVTAPGPAPYPYFVPGTMMVPVPIAPAPAPAPAPDPSGSQNTYITNYYYHGEPPASTDNTVQVVETSGDFDWVPTTATTATTLTERAVVGGHEGWDGSPLWVIRSWFNAELIPGKLSVRHSSASIVNGGKEIPVQNIEVLCAKPESLRWIPASNGNVPPGAIPGGRTASGETLYIGRARYQLSVTPGKVHPSHNACYIAFAGTEVSHKVYDVLCRIS